MNEYEDTYFFNAQEALRVASRQNRSQNGELLQACYYDGEKIESDLVNLIHLPVDNLLQELAMGRYRVPTKVDLTGLELSSVVKVDITTNFNASLYEAKKYREQYNEHYYNTLKKATLDFSEPLRFYLSSRVTTQVMQYVSKNIADALEEAGYVVMYDLYHGIEDGSCLKNLSAFNPHATININHFNNSFLNDNCFNFVWFQDPMPCLSDDSILPIRERDYVFSLVNQFDDLLQNKGVEVQRQSFCSNENIYKLDNSINRERKIVFIGNSYLNMIPEGDAQADSVIKYITSLFDDGVEFTHEVIDEISNLFYMDQYYLNTVIIPFVIRDISLLNLCQIKSDYEVEIYGSGWDRYEVLKPYYKGRLSYGQDIAKVYNSATFAFAPHQLYILQQRTLEASACGAIPIVYDCRNFSNEKTYEEAIVFFRTKKELETILLSSAPKKDFTQLLQENSYKSFVEKLLKIIQENI